jgi:hypothetical protein
LRQIRQEDDFNEINLHQFQEELNRLTKQLTKPSNISIREDSTPFISQISIERSGEMSTYILEHSYTAFLHNAQLKKWKGEHYLI